MGHFPWRTLRYVCQGSTALWPLGHPWLLIRLPYSIIPTIPKNPKPGQPGSCSWPLSYPVLLGDAWRCPSVSNTSPILGRPGWAHAFGFWNGNDTSFWSSMQQRLSPVFSLCSTMREMKREVQRKLSPWEMNLHPTFQQKPELSPTLCLQNLVSLLLCQKPNHQVPLPLMQYNQWHRHGPLSPFYHTRCQTDPSSLQALGFDQTSDD